MATNQPTADERRRFSLWVILVVLTVFGTGSALFVRGGQGILQLGIGGTAAVGLTLLWSGMQRLSAVLAIAACLVVPYVGLATDLIDTSAIMEIVWLVTAILVTGLILPFRWLVPCVVLHLAVTVVLTLSNPEIPLTSTWEVLTLLVLVASITSLTSATGERLDRKLTAGVREMGARQRELGLLERVGSALVEHQGSEAIRSSCEIIRHHLELALVSVYLLEPRAAFLRLVGHASYDFPKDHDGFDLSDRCLVARCAREGAVQHVPESPHRCPDYLEGIPEVQSEFVLPLRVEGRVIGVLNCEDTRPHTFRTEVQSVLGRVAHLCAFALERAEFLSRLEQGVLQRTEKLHREIAERKLVEEDLLRANRELELAQEEVLQAGKLAALGEMGAGMAHELNQPLAAIQALAEAIRESPGDRIQDHAGDLGLICDQVRRMARIVDNVRLFARQGLLSTERVPALAPLDDALTLLSNRFRLAGVEITPEIECGPISILADPVQLQHVFMNLLTNALQAVEGLEDEEPGRVLLRVRTDGDLVVYEVQDNGPGVPPGLESRIFEPFFTTKPPGAGTGLGLSLSYGIVQKHGGELRFEAPDDGGARFRVAIPAARPRVDPPPEEAHRDAASSKAGGRVLVVDDEQVVRFAFSRLLESWGWAVRTARSTSEALAAMEREPADLAIVDLRLPRGSGAELCAAIRNRWPATGLVAVSGHVGKEERASLKALGIEEVLGKPVAGDELRATIERVTA
ncbi:MAG: response regulator [Acidobacteriota bacterium]